LEYFAGESGVEFRCRNNATSLAYVDWIPGNAGLPRGGVARLGGLNALLESEEAQLADEYTVQVPHEAIARMDRWEAEGLGLPAAVEARLVLDTHGLLASPNFQVQYGFVRHNGVPLHGCHREGVFLMGPDGPSLLPDPLFSIAAMIDTYIASPITSLDDRFLWWAAIRELLPGDVVLGDFLRNINIVRPDMFSLQFRQGSDGLTFSPLFVARKDSGQEFEDTDPRYDSILPPAVQQEFSQRFYNQAEVGQRYGLQNGWVVVLPRTLREAAQVVMEMNHEPESRRLGFLHNPRAELRRRLEERLGDALDEDELESVFAETPAFLSERVLGLGAWQPKAGTYVKTKAGAPWFPGGEAPSVVGILIGRDVITLPVEKLSALHEEMQAALGRKQDRIIFEGLPIIVDENSCRAVAGCVAAISPTVPPNPIPPVEKPVSPGGSSGGEPLVPTIADNLDELGYTVEAGGNRKVTDATPPLMPGIVLHEHQTRGVDWLKHRYREGLPGALLADDMGLGKTLQTLVFLGWVREQVRAGFAPRLPFLVVAPKTLLENWAKECGLFLAEPGLGPLVPAHGKFFRDQARRDPEHAANELRESGWVLTNYETLRDSILVFGQVRWGAVVFDEAQKIKNPRAMMTDMAKALKADFTLALTGTPVENSLQDLWCILDTVHPGRLGPLKKFIADYCPGGATDDDALAQLKARLDEPAVAPVMIRRNKEEHWHERPEKRETPHLLDMPPVQANMYEQIVAQATMQVGQPGGVLKALQGLRSVSLHPFWQSYDGSNADAYIAQSARFQSCFKILDLIHEHGEKVLIFVEFHEIQSIMSELLEQRYRCGKIPIINGQIRGPLRQERVEAFQEGPNGFDAILLSPKAAGIGLTLTAATHVIHLTRWWNPAVEDQCSDRAYRIGQRRPVTIHHVLAVHPTYGESGSFDCNLNQMLERKRTLSRTLLAPPAPTEADLKDILDNTLHGAQTPG
jgi:hypothetical protein